MKKRGTRRCPYRDRRSLITPSLHLCSQLKLSVLIYKCSYLSSNYTPSTYTQQNSCISHKQRCRDGVINDLLSRYRHLLVPLFFMMRHPYIPLHFREIIFPLVIIMMTRNREIAYKRILARSIGGAYYSFGHMDSKILACE